MLYRRHHQLSLQQGPYLTLTVVLTMRQMRYWKDRARLSSFVWESRDNISFTLRNNLLDRIHSSIIETAAGQEATYPMAMFSVEKESPCDEQTNLNKQFLIVSTMANLLRTAKSGSDWTRAELDAYNIAIVPQTKAEFFGTNNLPDPTEPSLLGFMTNESRQTATDKKTKQLLHYLDLAMDPKMGQSRLLTTSPPNYCAGSTTMITTGLFSSGMPFLFSFAGRTRSHRLTFASWMTMKFCCCYRRVRG